MPRESMNLTQEQWDEIQSRRGGLSDLKYVNPPADPVGVALLKSNAARIPSRTGMNRWEQEYAIELEARKRAGEILWYGFESIKLRLATGTWYTPDFCLLVGDSISSPIQCVEIKGFLRDDANVKFKVAAEQFPCFQFLMLRRRKGGGWDLIKHLNGGR